MKVARKVAKQIPEFEGLAAVLVKLWKSRMATLSAS
jgi:hypothetical protein